MVKAILKALKGFSSSRVSGGQERSGPGPSGIRKDRKTGPSGRVKRPGRALRAPGVLFFGKGLRPPQVLGIWLLLLSLFLPAAAYAVPAGTVITNTAQADFLLEGNPVSAFSNSVAIVTTAIGTPSTLELFRYAPSSPSVSLTVGITEYFDGAGFSPMPVPAEPGTGLPVDLGAPVPLEPAEEFTRGEAVFVRLIDPDGNADPAVPDTIRVAVLDLSSATVEILLLTETGPDTGVFTGYVLSGAESESPYDGILCGPPGQSYFARYTDPADNTDISSRAFVFDPRGVLWVTASAGKDTVSVGDYLTYTVTVENTSGVTAPGVVLSADLPLGFGYMEGSTRIEDTFSEGLEGSVIFNAVLSDPAFSLDGRSLVFSVRDIPSGEVVTVTFATSVGAGARTGTSTAYYTASSVMAVSNTAAASVKIVEDLMRSRNTIMGRVLGGACRAGSANGVPGIAVFLEDGTRVVTDKEGRYHFEGVKSGTHVVQMDLDTVGEMYEAVACDEDTRQAERPWSRFVDFSGGALWRVDFYLVPKAPERGLAALSVETSAGSGQVVFHVSMSGDKVPLSNVRMRVALPAGVKYVPESARLEGRPVGEPEKKGSDLVWDLGDLPEGLGKGVTFQTCLRDGFDWLSLDFSRDIAEVRSSASLTFDTPAEKGVSTPPVSNLLFRVGRVMEDAITVREMDSPASFPSFGARLTTENREILSQLAAGFDPEVISGVTVTGHSDSLPIRERSRNIYADNYVLSRARARNVVDFLGKAWDLPPEMFTVVGVGPDAPLASNGTAEGRERNRRVENDVYTITIEKRAQVEPVQDNVRTEMIIVGLRPGEVATPPKNNPGPKAAETVDPTKNLEWLEREGGALRWVLPEPGFLPYIPSLKIAVAHRPDQTVRIHLNGDEINPLHYDSTKKNVLGTAALSVWRGVDIKEGDNTLAAVAYDRKGTKVGRIEQVIHLSSAPVRMEYRADLSRLAADGKTPPVIAIRLTDKDGYPARQGIIGQYYVQAPYRSLQRAEVEKKEGWSSNAPGYSSYSVREDGVAYLELEPTTKSGEVQVKVLIQGEEEELAVSLEARRDKWILVGLAEGTAGYNAVSGNIESLEDSGAAEDIYTDGRLAFFAKGRVKGKYLLTMSYDTSGPHGAAGEGHHGTIDPDTYYTLYGDAAGQDYEAPTSRKLYLKIERESFYAMFGDTDTGMTITELSRYNRAISGFRSEGKGERFSYNVFASETRQGFIRDEIPGDGTSGLYRLGAGDIVVNSEKVTIEVRDRFQSHVVLSSTTLARHTGYSIDYNDGTLFFKSPVPRTDESFNPVFIVVDYETQDPEATGVTYGGRGQAVLPGGPVVGLSVIHEDRGGGESDLIGLDAEISLPGEITVRAEAASSDGDQSGETFDGSAYFLEISREEGRLEGKAYIREQDAGFGVGQQNGSESGMRKSGAEAQYHLTETWSLVGEFYTKENLATKEEREVQELGVSREKGLLEYSASLRQATDSQPGEADEESTQMTAEANWESGDGVWRIGAIHEQSVGDNANAAYPTRTLLESEYKVTSNVSLSARQEFTRGDETAVNMTNVGLKATPWKGGAAASSVNREYNEDGDRVYAVTGLDQTWQVTSRWELSAGLEKATVLEQNTEEPINDKAAPVFSEEDFTAVSLGAGYTGERMEGNVRLESRTSDASDKWGIVAGVYNEPAPGIGLSSDLKHFRTEVDAGFTTTETDLRFGLVFRPWDRTWTFLDKLEFISDEESGGVPDTESWKMINNLNANYRPTDDLQVSFLLGTKYVKDTLYGQEFDGWTCLVGSEGRYDLTPRWDVGAWASVLTTVETGTTDYGLGASLGYGLMENVWVSFGYNLLGFEDSDFSRGNFTAQGPFVKFRIKFDQETFKDILRR